MERLTKRTAAGTPNLDYPKSCYYDNGGKDQVAVSAFRQRAIDRLAHYEDLEEQGRLVELPLLVGDTVYEVQQIRQRIQPMEIISARVGRMGELYFYWDLKDGEGIYGNVKGFGLSQLGKTVFLSRAEAEAALDEIRKESPIPVPRRRRPRRRKGTHAPNRD